MNPHLVIIPPELANTICGLLWKELTEEIARSKKGLHPINHERITELQNAYEKMVKHRKKVNLLINKI